MRFIQRVWSKAFVGVLGALVGVLALPPVLALAPAPSGAATVPGVTKGNITIGAVADLTGAQENQGTAFDSTFNAVIKSINAQGGIYGRKINLVTEDDQSTESGNLTATQGLVQAHHAFLVVQLSGDGQASYDYLKFEGEFRPSPLASRLPTSHRTICSRRQVALTPTPTTRPARKARPSSSWVRPRLEPLPSRVPRVPLESMLRSPRPWPSVSRRATSTPPWAPPGSRTSRPM